MGVACRARGASGSGRTRRRQARQRRAGRAQQGLGRRRLGRAGVGRERAEREAWARAAWACLCAQAGPVLVHCAPGSVLARFLDPVRLGIFLSHLMNTVHCQVNFF